MFFMCFTDLYIYMNTLFMFFVCVFFFQALTEVWVLLLVSGSEGLLHIYWFCVVLWPRHSTVASCEAGGTWPALSGTWCAFPRTWVNTSSAKALRGHPRPFLPLRSSVYESVVCKWWPVGQTLAHSWCEQSFIGTRPSMLVCSRIACGCLYVATAELHSYHRDHYSLEYLRSAHLQKLHQPLN